MSLKYIELRKNDEIRLTITTLTSVGSGLGRYNDMAVFVDGAAVGDELEVHIIKVKKNYAIGKIKKIIKPSENRIEVDCDAYTRCGGCAYRHISYSHELQEKKQMVTDAMRRIGKIDIDCEEILSIENETRYRNKAQIPVGLDENGKVVAGFYSRRSHRIIPCDDCLLQMPQFAPIIKAVKSYITENPVTVYNEETKKGLVRHIYLRRGRKTGEIMFCLVINGDNLPRAQKLIDKVLSTGENITSIVININKQDTNVVLGSECKTIYGKDYIEDELLSLTFRISPLSFYQVNPEGTELLYGKAKELADLKQGETLLDLYCGAGTIGLTMADKAEIIIGVEIIPEAIENAKENARLNGIENARFICDDAKGAAKTLYDEGIRPDVVILDPPRKGCSEEVVKTVCDMSPERVVYVSCDVSTLARDCALFGELGYEVKRLCAVDMFPRTIHCECVCLLTKADKS